MARGASAPGEAPIVRGATRLTARGWGLLGAAGICMVVAYSAGRTDLLYAACLLALLPLASVILVRNRRLRLQVVRAFRPPVVSAGGTTTVHVDVANRSFTRSTPATWADRIPWSPGTAGPGVLPTLSPYARGYTIRGSKTRLEYPLRPPQRGGYDIGPLEIEYFDPFSLAIGRASCAGTDTLLVTPTISQLGESVRLQASGDGTARLVQRNAIGNDDDLMTREYRRGDALRRVHWRASARHGELMVRQEEQRAFPEARVVLDTKRDGYSDVWQETGLLGRNDGTSGSFEWAVKMFASLGVKLHESGYLVHVVESAPAQVAPLGDPSQGSGQDFAFLVSLASIRLLPPGEAGAPGADPATRMGAAGSVFAVLSKPDAETLKWIASQRRPYETGVAFIVAGSDAAVKGLSDAGWTCVRASEGDDPADVWSGAVPADGAPMQQGAAR